MRAYGQRSHLAEDLPVRDHLAGVPDEEGEDLELDRREVDHRVRRTDGGHPPGEVCERLIGKFPAYRREPAFVDLWAPCRERIHEFAAAAGGAGPGSG